MDDSDQNKFRYYVQKLSLPITLVSVFLALWGVSLAMMGYPKDFFTLGIAAIMLYLLVHLTKPQGRRFKLGDISAKRDEKNVADELLKWHELREKNIISEAEFQKKKNELLNSDR